MIQIRLISLDFRHQLAWNGPPWIPYYVSGENTMHVAAGLAPSPPVFYPSHVFPVLNANQAETTLAELPNAETMLQVLMPLARVSGDLHGFHWHGQLWDFSSNTMCTRYRLGQVVQKKPPRTQGTPPWKLVGLVVSKRPLRKCSQPGTPMSQDKRYSRIFPAKKEHFPNKDQRVIAVFLHFEALHWDVKVSAYVEPR
jgi:hypothetical protein